MSDWQPDPKPVPPELDATFVHATYPPPPKRFATIAERLETADFETLKLWANGGTGDAQG